MRYGPGYPTSPGLAALRIDLIQPGPLQRAYAARIKALLREITCISPPLEVIWDQGRECYYTTTQDDFDRLGAAGELGLHVIPCQIMAGTEDYSGISFDHQEQEEEVDLEGEEEGVKGA